MKQEIYFTIPVPPRTKKNHGQLVTLKTGRQLMLPSKTYLEFEKAVKKWFENQDEAFQKIYITGAVNFKAVFYKDRNYKSDLAGYLQAVQDALVKIGMLEDDNHYVIASVDGSRVLLDRENPRIEITITMYERGEEYAESCKQNKKAA